ncbi:MAG: carboxypeptidase regulatory-like domain-containing protein [Myxococcaceae bacterium]|nr:carboxypeptidase regulatory-like domain-containing protein [Myxococcaceae bacterium]
MVRLSRVFVASSALLFACSNAQMGPGGTGGGGSTTSAGGGQASTAGGSGASAGGSGTGGEICNNRQDDDGDGFMDCADQDCFLNSACFATCVDLCSDGASICDGSGVRTCQLDTSTNCRAFAAPVACTNGLVCSGGACVATCSNQCTAGAKTCSNTGGVVECKTLASGCTDWVGPEMCATTEVCSGGACVPRGTCTNQCTAGTTRCTAGGQQQTCVAQGSGCTDWAFPAACSANFTCAAPNTSCTMVPRCTAGAVRCAATLPAVETCDANGNWVQSQSCPQACNLGACTTAAACTAGAVRCNANNVEICNASGSAWLYKSTCNVGCNMGLCTDPCTAGAKRCNGAVPETCATGGASWTAATACPNGCYLGECMEADLVVDGVTTTLEGDLSFKNDVIVRNGGSIKVGPTGVLKVRARNITIDAASNINANDVGNESRGASTGTAPTCCTYTSGSTCYCGPYSAGTASGASYGTAGTTGGGSSGSQYCSYSNSYRTCSATASASPLYDRDDDLTISAGSRFGATKGGGLVQLVASSVQVNGQITSNATGAGASGGGIFIAADSITGTGAIQATGGSTPAGGQGRVKLLRGATNSFTGSVTGKKADSPMPPLDIVSGSHPSADRWYNDGLGDWYLAWSKPFGTLNGYYYKLSTTDATLPSQAAGNGTFHQQETYVVKAESLVQGANYFHLVSVDSSFNVGNVKATAKMQLNTVPPTVASSSHPAQRTWYQNPALYFTWTNPQADENFSGYYYVLDKFADTVPAATTQNFTTSKQVLLPNTADGIWTFHIVNRDTRGAITKAARHYTVYVGTEPAKENISGSVFDASNMSAPLSGVTISVNHGLFSTTTTASGTYTFGGNLYVGQWEVTASKAGYLPQTKMLNLAMGSPLTENFTLMRAP